MTLQPIREVARGKWRAILPHFGIDATALSGKQEPCPLCGGKTRFRFDDKEGRGTWICNQASCGAGDGLQLVLAKTGLDFREAVKRIEDLAGAAPRVLPKPAQNEQRQRDAIADLWASSVPVTPDDPVDRYLRRRLGVLTIPPTIRFAERCRYQDDVPSWHPAMITKVSGPDGRTVTLHRTYLTATGEKAAVAAPRRNMPGHLPDGCAARLMASGRVMGIAEGIENAFAASKLFSVPCWSALNSVMLAKWRPPSGVSEVIVFADNDAKFAGQAAAYLLARHISEGGTGARVMIPEKVGTDWNDVLLERAA